MGIFRLLPFTTLITYVLGQCQFSGPAFACPYEGYNMCSSGSLGSNIIFRCIDGCAQPGNCNDNLAPVPPVGVKRDALCWESSSGSGDAQCTVDCAKVKRPDGSEFYPVGCSFSQSEPSGPASSTSIFVPSATSMSSPSTSPTTSPNLASHGGFEQTWGCMLVAVMMAALI